MNYKTLSEEDLAALFSDGKKRQRKTSRIRRLFLFVLVFVPVYFLVFMLLNYNSLSKSALFWYKTEYKNEPITTPTQSANLPKTTTNTGPGIPAIADNTLQIEAIEVLAPITWRIENDPEQVKVSLQNGLIQIKGTALPGEKGNTFITGHSSDLPWAKGKFKTVFALLNKLVVGDTVRLKYQNKDFVYKVTDIKTVNPDDLAAMDQTDDPTLTLMTCTPVGTNLKRLIVTTKQIYPDPLTAKKTNETQKQGGALPRAR